MNELNKIDCKEVWNMKPKQKTAGRPKGVYKHINPVNNQPIEAIQYYQVMRELKRKTGQKKEQSGFNLGLYDEGNIQLLVKIRNFVNELLEQELKLKRISSIVPEDGLEQP